VVSNPADVVKRPFPEISSATSLSDFRDEYLLREVLRKFPDYDLGVDRQERALSSFQDDERLNRLTNERLSSTNFSLDASVRKVFDLACRKAVGILGRFDVGEFAHRVRFGPGSTTSLSRRDASDGHKLSSSPHVTQRASDLAILVFEQFPLWKRLFDAYDGKFLCRESDVLTCVPKNALTDRVIAIGPDLNVALQLALGACIRARLWWSGVDLSDQSINQRRARQGSVDGELATLDLKSASNSVTTTLVWRMLGNHSAASADLRWYHLLDALRVPMYELNGETRTYELFSAMGNGATFEVESLIFHSLATATCEILGIPADVTVYGDDLVVPTGSVPLLKEVLEYAGFRLNDDKSFWADGPSCPRFRESCGEHYLDGYSVTPFYVDTPLDSVEAIVLAANNLVRWSLSPHGRDARVLPVYTWLISHLPKCVRDCRIPFGPENDGLICDFDEARPRVARLELCRTPYGWKCSVLKPVAYQNWEWTGDIAFVVNRFKASQKRFQPPKWDRPKEKLPHKLREEGKPESIELSGRVVTSWPYMGPWVHDDFFLSSNALDISLWSELARS
jgi:hypothetical protein